jgi:hypothetical protein
MRKTTLLFCLLWALGLSAQITVRDLLKSMPDSVIPYLTENNRLDMIDFMESNMDAVVTNTLGGKSQLLQLTDQYASIQLNESSSVAMRLLDVPTPVDSLSQILCLVRTYGSDIRESTIAFYSLAWRLLPISDYFSQPNDMFSATLGDKEPCLTLRQELILDSLGEEEKEKSKEVLTTLKWNGCFVKEN